MTVNDRQMYPETVLDESFELLRTESNTILRKIYGPYYISNFKPDINDNEECELLKKFLMKGNRSYYIIIATEH